MRYGIFAIAILVIGSCVPVDDKEPMNSEDQKEIRAHFEKWQKSVSDRDFDGFFEGITLRMRTLFMWHMTQSGNTKLLRTQMEKLSKDDQYDFEVWKIKNQDREEHKVALVPLSILTSDWFKETIQKYYDLVKDDLALQFSRLRIVDVYADDSAATVIIRNMRQGTELYNMINDGEAWKVDGHRLSGGAGN